MGVRVPVTARLAAVSFRKGKRLRRCALALLLTLSAQPALASKFRIPWFDGESFEAVSNTTLIGGVELRVEAQDSRKLAKGALDPNVCGRDAEGKLLYQSCQGLFRTQDFVSRHFVAAPGYASSNFDQGDLNYEQWDITQSGVRLNQDLTVTFGDHGWLKDAGFFVKGFAFWDPVNDNFDETYANRITRDNYQQSGFVSTPGTELVRLGNVSQVLSALSPLVSGLGLSDNVLGQLLSNPTAIPVLGVRNDSTPCPAARNPGGQPCGIVYGPGQRMKVPRKDRQTLGQIGKNIVLQDLNFYGALATPWEHDVRFRVGRQQVSWGEATVEFLGSLNIANPPNLNNLFRLGGNGLDDFYTPLNMVSLSTALMDGLSLSAFYQLEWEPLQAPAAGGFYSPVDINVHNGGQRYVTLGFGQLPDDPDGVGMLLDNPLSGITNTSGRIQRLADREPNSDGQYGIQLKYYADWLNDGTDIGLYFANYHSRIPIASLYSVDRSCMKDSTTTLGFSLACPDLPLLHGITNPNDPAGATSDTLGLDSAKLVLEYPRNIQMYGLSLNTTIGDWALQAELAYRPRDPMQVAVIDLAWAAFGPSLSNCHIAPGCPAGLGSVPGIGTKADGTVGTYPGSRYVVDEQGTPGAYNDIIFAAVGDIPGSGRSFPSFVVPYRGGTVGMNPANSYIRGWEYFQSLSYDLGGTYVEGSTDFTPHLIHADQVIWLLELGGNVVPDLPALDHLQLEAPGLQYHASAGADGSGADRSRMACSTNEACSYGPDGVRFNPHQQNKSLFPDKFSGGYAAVILIRYESVLPGISVQPQIIFKHDVYGTSPGLAANYVQGRILWDTGIEVRYRSNFSVNLGYRLIAGASAANLLSDRDSARVFLKYSF
ncbi:Protein of unknown function [Solimonas aquatica]|uniref:DUF1302 domain-containing protein n=1 Tax=Solimonas aquatica TaxID=489703 RepID=A0A1H9DJT7_9GAMM|nr:DUF1302 family protein [Solimonas aquatica]SEQ13671.1 Protein of unknown function [Solimonas aquatica]